MAKTSRLLQIALSSVSSTLLAGRMLRNQIVETAERAARAATQPSPEAIRYRDQIAAMKAGNRAMRRAAGSRRGKPHGKIIKTQMFARPGLPPVMLSLHATKGWRIRAQH